MSLLVRNKAYRAQCENASVAELKRMCADYNIAPLRYKDYIVEQLTVHHLAGGLVELPEKDLIAICAANDMKLVTTDISTLVGSAIASCYSHHMVSKTVVEIREMCRESGLSPTGNRADIIHRYCNHIGQTWMQSYKPPKKTRVRTEEEVKTPPLKYPEGLAEDMVVSCGRKIYLLRDYKKCEFTAWGLHEAGAPLPLEILESQASDLANGPMVC